MKPEDFGIKKYSWNNGLLDVNQSVDLHNKKLTEIPFEFGVVKGNFDCSRNQLTSLKNSPKVVQKSFKCTDNLLKDLQGSPEKTFNFDCSENLLVSLVGCPKVIGQMFRCVDNKLRTVDDFPESKVDHLIFAKNLDLQEIPDAVLEKVRCNILVYKTSVFYINPKFNIKIDHYENNLLQAVISAKEFNQIHVSKRIKQSISVSF